jgi:membrane fusion protein (multidrug efflux system)
VVSQLGLGTVSTTNVALLRAGLPVHFRADSGVTTTGLVQQVSKPLANHEAEVIMTFAPATTTLQQGDFGQVTISVPGEKPALVVPRESVIRGTSGNLVYAVNGDAYILTWVEVGVESDGFVEITDGLLAGDSVVTSGAMDLWLVELRAVKGGQGCCPAPPKKGKN